MPDKPSYKVRVEYPEGDYSEDIKRSDEEMADAARAMQRSSGILSRGFAPEMYEGYKEQMQKAAERGMRQRRSRKRLHELGETFAHMADEPARTPPRRAKRKRD